MIKKLSMPIVPPSVPPGSKTAMPYSGFVAVTLKPGLTTLHQSIIVVGQASIQALAAEMSSS